MDKQMINQLLEQLFEQFMTFSIEKREELPKILVILVFLLILIRKNKGETIALNLRKTQINKALDILCKKISESKLGDFVKISGCDAGMHLLLTVENGMKQNELLASAAIEGVKVYGLSEYYSFPVSNMPENIVKAGPKAK